MDTLTAAGVRIPCPTTPHLCNYTDFEFLSCSFPFTTYEQIEQFMQHVNEAVTLTSKTQMHVYTNVTNRGLQYEEVSPRLFPDRTINKHVYFFHVNRANPMTPATTTVGTSHLNHYMLMRPVEIPSTSIRYSIGKVDYWRLAPEDVLARIFLEYCDYESIINTRFLQTERVRVMTQGNSMTRAIHANNLMNMKWIFRNYQVPRYQLRAAHFHEAATGGNLVLMQWLLDNNCPWDTRTFTSAARRGDLNIMQWLLANNCPWEPATFESAVQFGNVQNMVWLRANDAPWNNWVFRRAAYECDGENFEVMDFLFNNNCPFTERTFYRYSINENTQQWLHNHNMATYGVRR